MFGNKNYPDETVAKIPNISSYTYGLVEWNKTGRIKAIQIAFKDEKQMKGFMHGHHGSSVNEDIGREASVCVFHDFPRPAIGL